MDVNDTLPRFFKVFISQFSSDSMLIPISYYDQLPFPLPKTAILQGTGGCLWTVAMKQKQEEVFFGQGWSKFVKDNSISDCDFMTFVYNGDRIFEVSIYSQNGCKEHRAVTYGKEVSISSLSSKDIDSSSESERANTILKSKNKGKSEVVVLEDSDDEEEESDSSLCSEDTETYTCSESNLRSKNQGKKKVVEDSDEDSDDCAEAFNSLYFEEKSNSDSSYDLSSQETAIYVKPKGTNLKNKVKSKIDNPEVYLDNPGNVYFETSLKNRKYELLIHSRLVIDYCLKFQDFVYLIDNHKAGELEAKTEQWSDERVIIKKWNHICERNNVKKEDAILCELLRKKNVVYAVKIHIIRKKDL
ncbi:unnamed protein product [Cochlearia groenlandica]